jgi:hypothetical protein
MTTLVSAVDTEFTPSAGDFVVQCTGGEAMLYRKQTSGAAWVPVGEVNPAQAQAVYNPVGGVIYKFTTLTGIPVVQADQ